jgi:hypothetical protein
MSHNIITYDKKMHNDRSSINGSIILHNVGLSINISMSTSTRKNFEMFSYTQEKNVLQYWHGSHWLWHRAALSLLMHRLHKHL